MNFQEMKEFRMQSGVGAQMFKMDADSKFSVFLPMETIPAVGGTPDSIEVDVTSSSTVSKIPGKMKLEDKDVEFILHRDSLRKLKQAEKEGVGRYLIVNPDYTAVQFNARVSYSQNDVKSGEIVKGTFKITPTSIGENNGFIDNCYDLLKHTALFDDGIPPVVELETTNGTFETPIITVPADSTVEATSETTGVATATITSGKLTVTGVKEGSAVIKLKASKTGYASWETTILVIVPKAVA